MSRNVNFLEKKETNKQFKNSRKTEGATFNKIQRRHGKQRYRDKGKLMHV
eukprot:m.172420 g.172420  ORF g.172420 m.172420 type:complete len:50 (-) comp31685_c4_seq1:73-222(-)